MSAEFSNQELDARLRNVSIPADLLERLKGVACGSQEQMDQQLLDVPVPAGLLSSLHSIPATEEPATEDRERRSDTSKSATSRSRLPVARDLSDDSSSTADRVLDASLNLVSVPAEMPVRLRRIPVEEAWARRDRWLPAAVLTMVVCLAFQATISAVINGVRRDVDRATSELEVPGYAWEVEGSTIVTSPSGWLRPAEQDLEPLPRNLTRPRTTLPSEDVVDVPPVVARARSFIAAHDLNEDIFLNRYGTHGAPQYEDDVVPDLRFVSMISARGFRLPLVPGYDREFLLKFGVRPPIFPTAHPRLQGLSVPLSPTTESYDDARLLLEEKQWPLRRNVRVEDFLAALRYRFKPAEAGDVGLRVASGPSVFGGPRAKLLQIGAQAGTAPRESRIPVHVVVAVDTSNSMRWSRKLESVRDALRQLLSHMQPQDRLSLISFNEGVRIVLDRQTSRRRATIDEAIDALTPRGGTNVCGALHVAMNHALQTWTKEWQSQVVLITDDRNPLQVKPVSELTQLLTQSRGKIKTTFVDVDLGEASSATLSAWARATQGQVERANSPEKIRWSLVTALLPDPVVARRTVVNVRFDPSTVAAYRLVGHDVSRVQNPVEVQAEATLRSGQSAMCLFEFWLRAGTGAQVAEVRLEWTDRQQRKQVRTEVIYRWQVAVDGQEVPLSVQAAAIAAETGEVLRGSPFIDGLSSAGRFEYHKRPDGLGHVVRQARQLHSQLGQQDDVLKFLNVLGRLERVGRQVNK